MMNYQNPYYRSTTPTIQSTGFVRAEEDEARQYPVAAGNSVMFIDGAGQHLFVKTLGFSPFDQARFEKYKIVKIENEETDFPRSDVLPMAEYASADELKALRKEVDRLSQSLKNKIKNQNQNRRDD